MSHLYVIRLRAFWAALVLAAAPTPMALAHEFWLSPSRYDASPGTPVIVGAHAGTGFRGDWKPWSPNHGRRFTVRAATSLDLARIAAAGESEWVRFAPSDGGGAMMAFVSDFTPITLDAAAFDRYLNDEGLRRAAAIRNATRSRGAGGTPGRERYRRCAKAWLAGDEAARATSPLGLPFEIVPASIPGASPRLTVRVLRSGRPLAGALVKAWRSPLAGGGLTRNPATRDSMGVSYRGTTDDRGEVRVPVAERGEWLISTVDMTPSADRAVADWESTWASLTFARP